MGRRVVCKVTGESGDSDKFYKGKDGYYKTKEIYDRSLVQRDSWKKCVEIIVTDFLHHSKNQEFPKYLTQRLSKLEMWGYDTVYDTIIRHRKDIEYTEKIDFEKEVQKISYIFAIIESHIEDVFEYNKNRKEHERKEVEQMQNNSGTKANARIGTSKKGRDITKFL